MNAEAAAALSTGDLALLRPAFASMTPATDDAERIDRIRLLEELKGAVAAAQAVETAAFVASQRRMQREAGVPAERIGRGVSAQVALARRESPYRAGRYCGWASILTAELPATLAQLRSGAITEWRAMIVARETAWLSREHRAQVDDALAPRLSTLGDRRVEAEAKRAAYRLDPAGYLDRLHAAEADRRVTLRPAPDCMTRLSALLPVAQGVATYAALLRAADNARAAGDTRTRGQVMADTLVERATGQIAAPDVPVEICVVMTDTALLDRPSPGGHDEPASVLGYGPVPAAWARLLLGRVAPSTPMWIRRLYRAPGTSQLAAMESRRRVFTPAQRLFLRIVGGGICATPWCNAPIRHIDHIRPVAQGGRTEVGNGQGLCQACNHAKQAKGWTSSIAGPSGSVRTTTPTGHSYPDRRPPPDLIWHYRPDDHAA